MQIKSGLEAKRLSGILFMSKNITTKSKNATKIRKNATKTTKKCGQCPENAFNASILFQKSSDCKKCFFNAGTIARCLATSPKKSTFIINLHTLQSEILNCIFHSEWIHRTIDTVISARMMHSHCNILHSHNLKLLMYSLDYLTSVNSCINKAFRIINKYRSVTSKSSFSAKSLIFENSSKKKKLRVQYGKIRTQ